MSVCNRGAAGTRHVTARSEESVGHAADGYARTTGRARGCLVTSRPAVDGLAAVGTSHEDSVPLLVIAPHPPRGLEGAGIGELHETQDQGGHLAGVVETSVRVCSAPEAARRLDTASGGGAAAELERHARPETGVDQRSR